MPDFPNFDNRPATAGDTSLNTGIEVVQDGEAASPFTPKSEANAALAAIVVGVVALGIGIAIGIKHKLRWWYYLLLLLFIVPLARFGIAATVLLFSKKQ